MTACDGDGGTIAGPDPKRSISLDFCAGSIPIWFAVQNEDEAWQQVTGSAAGSFSFEATRQVSIAFVTTPVGSGFITNVLNVDRDELEAIAGDPCREISGSKTLNGSVTGLTGAQVVRLSMSPLVVAATTATNSMFSLAALPDGPLDLVATRFPTATTQPSDRIIVRRNLDLASGSTIPALDFGAAEAQPLATAIATFANRGNDLVDLGVEYLTANVTRHPLMQTTNLSATSALFVSVPSALRGPDDLHRLTAIASAASGTREVTQFYRSPSDRTLTFGPVLSAPASSVASTTPYVRPRLTIAAQAEYPTAMEAFFGQLTGGTFREITIRTTAAFLGGVPATWTLELPDFSAAGYDNLWAFPNATGINTNARGYDGPVFLFSEFVASDGDMIKSAIRSVP
jgi:hypothetical protein